MCDCGPGVEVGNFKNQVVLPLPWSGVSMGIDRCLSSEIQDLWARGIRTTGCCCGHNEHVGYIGVDDIDIEQMKNLHYQMAFNSCRPADQDSFLPKTALPNTPYPGRDI